MRARFFFAFAVLGGAFCSSCFIPGFTVGADSTDGGTATGGAGSGGEGVGGEGGAPASGGDGSGGGGSCEPIDPPEGLTLRTTQGAGPHRFELSSSVVSVASRSGRGFTTRLEGTRLVLEAPSTFFGWDTVTATFEEGCTTLRLRVTPGEGGALEELADGVLTGLPTGGSLSLAASDTDGDGRADLVIGAPGGGSGAGAVFVVRGARDFWGGERDVEDLGGETLPGFTVKGAAGDAVGASVASSGDFDCSGKSSVLLGAPNNARAYVVKDHADGAVVELTTPTEDVFVFAGDAGSQLGFSVAGGQDVNGDGVPDLVLGAPSFDSNTGLVTVVFGGFVGCSCDDSCAASPFDTTAPGVHGFVINDSIGGWQLGRHVALLGNVLGNSSDDLGLATNNRFILVTGRNDTAALSCRTGSGVSFDSGSTTLSSAAPGFDGDDQPDYVYCQGTSCSVIRGSGGGGIELDGFSVTAQVAFGGKLNDDARDDLIAFEGPKAWVVFGRSAGSAGATIELGDLQGGGYTLELGAGQISAATRLGDWDGDGFDDFAVADSANGKVYLLRGGP